MDAITMIKERRSVRKYKDEKVDRETMREIENCRYSEMGSFLGKLPNS